MINLEDLARETAEKILPDTDYRLIREYILSALQTAVIAQLKEITGDCPN